MASLQDQVAELKAENARLALSQTSTPCPTRASAIEKDRPTASTVLNNIIRESLPSKKYHAQLQDILRTRALKTKEDLDTLQTGLETVMPVQVCDWLLSQRPSFYVDQHGLFESLFRDELKTSPDQLQKLLSLRQAKKERVTDSAIAEAFEQLSKLLKMRGALDAPDQFLRLCSLLTPDQFASYVKWVKSFGHICVKINV